MEKEEYVIILDYLPHGYPLEGKTMPAAQAIGEMNLVLLELIPRRGVSLEIGERVYIGEGKRDKIYYIFGRLKKEKITEPAKEQLQIVIENVVKKREKEFVDFFNKSESINKRIHQIELIPGLGKKYVEEILEQRNIKSFESFEDMKKRIHNLPFPEKAIEKRNIMLGNDKMVVLVTDDIEGKYQCVTCSMYVPETGECTNVLGHIEPEGTCQLRMTGSNAKPSQINTFRLLKEEAGYDERE